MDSTRRAVLGLLALLPFGGTVSAAAKIKLKLNRLLLPQPSPPATPTPLAGTESQTLRLVYVWRQIGEYYGWTECPMVDLKVGEHFLMVDPVAGNIVDNSVFEVTEPPGLTENLRRSVTSKYIREVTAAEAASLKSRVLMVEMFVPAGKQREFVRRLKRSFSK